MPIYRNGLKRALDCVIAVPVLALAAIPMGLIALAVKLDSPGPVLFRQKRLGKDGREFEMLKFRSMCVNSLSSIRRPCPSWPTPKSWPVWPT